MKNIALIVASGSGTRCGFDKVFDKRFGKNCLEMVLETFGSCEAIDDIFLIVSPQKASEINLDDFTDISNQKLKSIVAGGNHRYESVKNGVKEIECFFGGENHRIIVHNAANPYLSLKDLNEGLAKSETHKNIIFGFYSPNAIKKTKNDRVIDFLDRDHIFETQTPQISDSKSLLSAIDNFSPHAEPPRDEAELLSRNGERIFVFECNYSNSKITIADDFRTSRHSESGLNTNEALTLSNSIDEPMAWAPLIPMLNMAHYQFGLGEDSHRFTAEFQADKPMVLGGVQMPDSHLSFDANSDGDIILHSLCNAFMSAFGEPTFDIIAGPMCDAGIIDSTKYVAATRNYLHQKGFDINIHQVLISLEGLKPKLAPEHHKIVSKVAELLKIEAPKVGLTYTTGERMTMAGRGEGMRCSVLVVLER